MSQLTVTQNNSIAVNDDDKKMQLVKEVFFKNATNEEFELFKHACARTGLDPFMKQIYPVKRWDSTLKKEVMTVQTGIDGYRLIADRTGCYAPGKQATFEYNKDGKLLSATAYVKKLTRDGTWHEISATAFYEEYCQRTKEGLATSMWNKMPHSQLAKCAESLALRKAFPAELSGIYTREEMEQAEVVVTNVEPKAVAKLSETQVRDLQDLFDQCEPDYVKSILGHCKVKSIDEIPSDLFTRIKNAALKEIGELLEAANA